MGTLDHLLAGLSGSSVERGRDFERLVKWFLENDPRYRSLLDEVWLWSDWPKRWGPDTGIDLVARARDGGLWAIQAKAYSPDSTVSKADVDSFLSESSRDGFTFRLLVATTDRLSANAKRTLAGQKVPVEALLLTHLVDASVDWPVSLRSLRPTRRESFTARPHQERAVRAVLDGFKDVDRGQLIMACGTGKTLTSLFIAERLESTRVLVLVPSLSLLAQTLTAWTANASRPIEFLPVCSDSTVVERDSPVESTADLGFPVTTDPGEIAAFLRKRGDTLRVVFATYQSSERVEAAQRLARVPGFDLAIADEAHRCTGNVTSDFATVLDAGKIRASRRLFMTATPRILSVRAQRSAIEEGADFASMDDEDRFGSVLHRLTFATAIDEGLLADYRVVILGVDSEATLRAIQERELLTTDGHGVISADRLGAAVGLAKAIRDYGLTRIISFHGRVKAASDFAALFPGVVGWIPARERPKGVVEADFISGDMSAGVRKQLINHLTDSPADRVVLANARVLTEGIDVPDLDGVAFMDPRNSEIDIVQAVGRAIRKPQGRNPDKVGTIVLPIVIEQTGDDAAELDRTDYQTIWAVLRALRAHDERLAEEIDALRRDLGRRRRIRHSDLPDRIIIDLPRQVDAAFAHALSTRLITSTSSPWEEGFGHLEAFAAEHRHARPATGLVVDGYRLGQWVGNQRNRRDWLAAARKARLEALPGWTWNPHDTRWEAGFGQLEAFVAEHGHARPAQGLVVDGYPLGTWVNAQRNRRDRLDAERQARLAALPGWTWDARDTLWEEGFGRLEAFVAEHGHARPAAKSVVDGYRLGGWVSVQRTGRDRLAAARRARLEALPGWTWDPFDTLWEEGFGRLRAFVAEHGHARPGENLMVDGYRLGQWVSVQRHRRDRLDAARQARLEALPGWTWNPHDTRWEAGFGQLEAFVAEHGHARPAKGLVVDGFRLGSWANRQRSSRDRLDAARKARLEALPGWTWDARDTLWEEGLSQLEAFAAEHGHARPERGAVVDGYRLGQWVGVQRTRRESLSPARQARLEALPGWTWDARRPRVE